MATDKFTNVSPDVFAQREQKLLELGFVLDENVYTWYGILEISKAIVFRCADSSFKADYERFKNRIKEYNYPLKAGVETMRAQVLEFLNQDKKFTRAELKEFIESIKIEYATVMVTR